MFKRFLLATTLAVFTGIAAGQQIRDLGLRGDRFRPLTWQELTPPQQTMVNELLAGKRGTLGGPFNVFLRSPEVGNLAQKVGEHVRFRSSLSPRLNEMAILMTAKWWASQYEWHAHKPLALKAGLSAEVVDALHAGSRPRGCSQTRPSSTIFRPSSANAAASAMRPSAAP